jgi:pimeloyl-ACP methyl ester carboxylesterase
LNAQTIVLPDGRKLGYTTIGKGAPVIYFHGTASSRLEVSLLKKLADSGLQLIGIDRPGYGLSTYTPRKNLLNFNADINYLADFLGLERFGVLSWSGGGVFALAYCASNPNRVSKAVLVASPSLPFDVSTAHNMPAARYVMRLPFVGEFAMGRLSRELLKANSNVKTFLASRQGQELLRGCSKSDLKFLEDPVWVQGLYASMVEAFRQGHLGVKAVVEEHQIFLKPWSLPFSGFEGANLHIWHGKQDLTCRVNNAYALKKLLRQAELEVFDGSGHYLMFEHLDRIASIFS